MNGSSSTTFVKASPTKHIHDDSELDPRMNLGPVHDVKPKGKTSTGQGFYKEPAPQVATMPPPMAETSSKASSSTFEDTKPSNDLRR